MPTTAASIGCFATWCRTSPAGAPGTRSSTGCAASGTSTIRSRRSWGGCATSSTASPSCAGRHRSCSSGSTRTSPRWRLDRSPTWATWSNSLAQHGVESSRVELDLGFGRGIGFYTQMIFELVVATPGGPVEVCGGGRYDGLARVLGSDRDDRGVGFAFGLERLAETRAASGLTQLK